MGRTCDCARLTTAKGFSVERYKLDLIVPVLMQQHHRAHVAPLETMLR
jgi:hypothetical protein